MMNQQGKAMHMMKTSMKMWDDEYNREMLQEEKDKAQAIHAETVCLMLLLEEATFIIEAVDPLTQERLGEAEATMLQPIYM